jgi:hypothetical protein
VKHKVVRGASDGGWNLELADGSYIRYQYNLCGKQDQGEDF